MKFIDVVAAAALAALGLVVAALVGALIAALIHLAFPEYAGGAGQAHATGLFAMALTCALAAFVFHQGGKPAPMWIFAVLGVAALFCGFLAASPALAAR